MLENRRKLTLDIFDYLGHKQCSLYDYTSDIAGQACDVVVTSERNGWKEASFTIPQKIQTADGEADNPRLSYIKEGYRIRLVDEDGPDWYILSESKVTHNNLTKTYRITAGHVCQLLKHKRLDLEFSDDEGNNVGTAAMLLDTILEGTGWKPGFVDTFMEKDGSGEKYRSLKASKKTGAFKLIANMCDLFEAKPVYHGDSKTVDIVPMNPFSEPKNGGLPDVLNEDVVELHYGTNVSNVTRTLNEENMITRLYAYGAYGDKTDGYCGIDECEHTVYTLTVAEGGGPAFGTECMINFTDADGIEIIRYFRAGIPGIDYPTIGQTQDDISELPNSQEICTILYSDLDPASRMYVWDPVNEAAYLLYENREDEEIGAYFTEDTSLRKKEMNWFSSLMDFHYYSDIGLLTYEMLQTIAIYQVEAPPLMQIVNEKATELGEKMTDLSETIGSVDFCKLSGILSKPQNSYVTIDLDTDHYPKGVEYRTDYDKKEDKQFKWRVADELKANGDPVHDVASIVYLIYEAYNGEPFMYEKAYLKEIDDEENPTRLTLWLPSEKSKYFGQPYRMYLFAQHNINGLLGAYETSDEATQIAIDSATKIVTVKHPVFYEKDEPKHDRATINGYGWWWKWFEGDRESQFYFCWNTVDKDGNVVYDDDMWYPVTVSSVDPEAGQYGKYWYNWKKAKLFRSEKGYWVAKTETSSDKRVSAIFGSVLSACQTRDRYSKGVYQDYTYTEDDALPAGNYAFQNKYGQYWVFTTTEDLSAGDTLSYDTTLNTVTQTVNGVDDILEVKPYRFDNVNYHQENILEGSSCEQGGLDTETGGETENEESYRTGFLKAYPETPYIYLGYYGFLDVFYYDENRRYLGHEVVDATWGNEEIYSATNTEYIRLVGEREINAEEVNVSTPNVNDKIITKEDQTYTIIKPIVGSGELKGITPLTKKFADSADDVYGVCYPALRSAQDAVNRFETDMTTSLGDLYREGYWQKSDYVDGDEKKLYDDALENLEKLSKPEAKYEITYIDPYGANDHIYNSSVIDGRGTIMWPDVSTQSAAHLVDPDIGINTWAFVDKVDKCYDQSWKTKIAINTNLTTITQHSFTDVMTHIADVASETKGKMSVYERAAAITETGQIVADRLEGKIDADKLKIQGGSSTWYTDDRGNMVFVSADGNSAMTLTGNGFCIANSKDEYGDWVWRTFGTGEGFTADEIVAGYLSAERILAGSITTSHLAAGVGEELDISSNKALKLIVSNLVEDYTEKINEAFIEITPDYIAEKVMSSEIFVDEYPTRNDVGEAIDGIMIGSRNYIPNSKDMILEGTHTLIVCDYNNLVGTAYVGSSFVG